MSRDSPERYANLSNVRCGEPNLASDAYEWADSYCPTDYTWMAVLGLALFVMGFAPGQNKVEYQYNEFERNLAFLKTYIQSMVYIVDSHY